MPNFKNLENQLITRLDKWLYFIKYLEDFQTIPTIFADEVFTRAFEKAELAKFGQEELEKYEMNFKIYRYYKNTVDPAFDEGKLEIAKSLKKLGVSIETIIQATGIAMEAIEEL